MNISSTSLGFCCSQPLSSSTFTSNAYSLRSNLSPTTFRHNYHHSQKPQTPIFSPIHATATPTPPQTTTPSTTINPQSPPSSYPPPTGLPGKQAAVVRKCDSIPSVLLSLATDPSTASLPALVDNHHGDEKITLTFEQIRQRVIKLSAGLKALGLSRGEFVSLFSENSHRWFLMDQAVMSVGAASAVRGIAAPVQELRYIYDHSESVALIVETSAVLERLVAAGLDRTKVRFAIVLYGDVSTPQALLPGIRVLSFTDLEEIQPNATDIAPAATRDDVATLLYTSGTTGHPKGVVLTHSNILSQLEDISLGQLDPLPGEVFVSVLPCWHVFERTAEYWVLSKGVQIVYSDKRTFRNDLAKHRPHMLISVPRVFENLHSTIMTKLQTASAIRKALFAAFMAISLAFIKARRRLRGWDLHTDNRTSFPKKLLDLLQVTLLIPFYALADKLIWSKIRSNLGGRLRICLSGGGSIASYLEDFFECSGIDICVGYGMTETSPVIANRFGEHNVRGSTGMSLPRAYVKIVDRETHQPVKPKEPGLLHVRGPYVFSKYLKNPEATAKGFDNEGYFNTGDLAYYTEDGDIVISGRDKDLIVLSNGENVEPAPIEDAILASSLVDQIMLVGQDEKALCAVVVPKLDELQNEGLIDEEFVEKVNALGASPAENRIQLRSLESELLSIPSVAARLKAEIRSHNEKRVGYSSNERVLNLRVILVPFTVENGLMTQTLKIKRDAITELYASEIAALFKA